MALIASPLSKNIGFINRKMSCFFMKILHFYMNLTTAVELHAKDLKEPASNGAPCTKLLFESKAKGSLSSDLLIQVLNEKAIHLEERPCKTPTISVRTPKCASK